ncbi:hypothetical protein QP028_03085 [Corynebacterium suedekumii]|nr:hypothetical protein QP028_03085 [Corynebacterium suedekumii]
MFRGDADKPVRVGRTLARLTTQQRPHPGDRRRQQREQDHRDTPVGHDVQLLRLQRGRRVTGVEQHADPSSGASRRLSSSSEECGHRPGPAQQERECEHPDQADHGGIGQLVTE